MPLRPHDRPTAILTALFAVAFGPRRIARPVALSLAALNNRLVMLIAPPHSAHSVPKPAGTAWLESLERSKDLAQRSLLPPRPSTCLHPPSNVWGVGYKLVEEKP
jgi:hypothetical protein